jgi:outer membrane receptor protein involved in Fe transport
MRVHLALWTAFVLVSVVPLAAQTNPLPATLASTVPQDSTSADDVVVVTASRREQQRDDAPATMTVLTRDVIASAPNLTVTDLLRMVPGVNTVQTSARDVNVTVRAATGTLSDSTLVLLDGRSVYQDFFGFVLWDFLPIDSDEIRQIEVIRGPASAVWGANAMTGVINVISLRPREMQGTTVSIRFGEFDRSPAGAPFDGGGLMTINATHAEAVNSRLAFKGSFGLVGQEALLRPVGNIPGTSTPFPAFPNLGTTQPRADGRVDYDFPDGRQRVIVAGGFSGTSGIVHTGLGPLAIGSGSAFTYGRVAYSRDRLRLQFFVNVLQARASAVLLKGLDGAALPFRFADQAYDAEVADATVMGTRHLLSYGGNYRHNAFDLSAATGAHTRNEGGAYAQDEIFLSPRLRWIVGSRVDVVDVLHKPVVSPRTTLLFKPRQAQTVRLSYNRAFRAPSFLNSFLAVDFLQEIDLGAAGMFKVPITAAGDAHLHEEQLTAYEAAFIGVYGSVTAEAATYVNQTRNMIQFTQAGTYRSEDPPPGWPLPPANLDALASGGHGIPSRFAYANFDSITDRGVELSVQGRLVASTTLFGNYSWQHRPEPRGFDISELNIPPTHRANAGGSLARGRYFGSATVNYVGSAYWQDVGPRYVGRTPAYAQVNVGAGIHSSDRMMTVAVRVNNLLNRATQQHVFGDIIRRTVTGEVQFHF